MTPCFASGSDDEEQEAVDSMSEQIPLQQLQVPLGVHEFQWFAQHAVHFYDSIAMFYQRVSRICTKASCPIMNAGPKYHYHWKQSTTGKLVQLNAPLYCHHLFQWILEQFNDRLVFPLPDSPTENSVPMDSFAPVFRQVISSIFRRLFRVFAHLYYAHFTRLQSIGMAKPLNQRFLHFASFALYYHLIPPAELMPLRPLLCLRLPRSLTEVLHKRVTS